MAGLTCIFCARAWRCCPILQSVVLIVGGCPRRYAVRAVVALSGDAAGGHYVCVARTEHGPRCRWWLADDEAVTPAEDWGCCRGGAEGAPYEGSPPLEALVAPPPRPLSDLPLFRAHAALVFACEAMDDVDHRVDVK
jgi:hypothetical protein